MRILYGVNYFFVIFLAYIISWPSSLIVPRDFRAKLCGQDKFESMPYLYFLAPTIDPKVAMCVENCPTTTGKSICLYDGFSLEPTTFCYTELETKTVGLYCYPDESAPRANIDSFLSQGKNMIKRLIGDLYSVRFPPLTNLRPGKS